jgi:endonuclease/exonuclease/phosphatase family metal-dependent hydrolase
MMACLPAAAQLRVVTYNISALEGNAADLQAVFAACHADDAVGPAQPIDIICFQECPQAAVGPIGNLLAASAPVGVGYTLATYTTSSSEDGATGAQALFYRTGRFTEITSGHLDLSTGGGRNSDRWLLQVSGYSSAAARLYVYSSHLKASSGSANESERLAGATTLRNNADALPAGSNIIFLGDYNMYTNTESGYVKMTTGGVHPAIDPWGTANWTGASNAIKHTQSPRLTSTNLVGGGVDDRFDLHLFTAALNDGAGLAYIPGTVRTLGNDGNHFDIAVNTGNNTYYPDNIARSNALADALHDASDHFPVIVEYQVPAALSATLQALPPRVLVGAAVPVRAVVSNVAQGVWAAGIDDLPFSVSGSQSVVGSSSGQAPLSPATAIGQLALNTSSAGIASGIVTVTTTAQAAANPTIQLPVSVQVSAHANPSFSTTADQDTRALVWAFPAGTVNAEIDVTIANFGFAGTASLLVIDGITSSGQAISAVSGIGSQVGATPGTIRLRLPGSAALAPGSYPATVQVQSSDENLPGRQSYSSTINVTITVEGSSRPEDINQDGIVDGGDLAVLLSQWGTTGEADIDGSGLVDGSDLGMLLSAWG